MSAQLVPIEVVRGAQNIPFSYPEGWTSGAADLHTFQSTGAGPLTSGSYKASVGTTKTSEYNYAESKIVLLGEINIYDHATRITHTVTQGDFVYLPIGCKVDFSSDSYGLAFYVVTRDATHPYPSGRGAKL